jgi:Bacterial capsule synthesis protein PGA_cap
MSTRSQRPHLAAGLAAALSLTLLSGAQAASYPLPNAPEPNPIDWLIEALSSQYFSPVMDNPALVSKQPIKATLLANNTTPTRRILMFGDLHGVNGHVPPKVDAAVLALFQRADLVIGNLESPIVPTSVREGNQTSNFHMTVKYVREVSAAFGITAGKQVYSVANNHANDLDPDTQMGRWPLTLKSVSELQSPEGFKFTGIDQNVLNTPEVTVVDLNGLRVGVMGWTHVENRAAPAGYRPWLTDSRALYKPDLLLNAQPRDFTALKSNLQLKLLIGMPHWDVQFHAFPSQETVAQAKLMMSQGMDVVAGAHQSTPQPVAKGAALNGKKAITFFGLDQLYTSVDDWNNYAKRPLLSMVTELTVNTSGELVSYEVMPLIRRAVNPAPLAALQACGAPTPSGHTGEVITLQRLRCEVNKLKGTANAEVSPYKEAAAALKAFDGWLWNVYGCTCTSLSSSACPCP